MTTDRSRRATLAFLLALLASAGMGLGATGVARLADGAYVAGGVLLALGGAFIASAFRWLRGINTRSTPGDPPTRPDDPPPRS